MIRKADWSGGREPCVWTRLGLPALGVVLLLACGRASKPTAPGCCEKSGPGWTDDAGTDSAASGATAPAKPPARFRAEDGCARDFKTSGEPGRDLGELERLCAQGLTPVLAPTENTRASGSAPVEVPFRVTGSTACLRAGAVGVWPGQILSLESATGKVLAAAAATEAIALVPVDGTVCVREAGVYRLVVKAAPSAEARTLTVQVWQASRD